MQDIKLLKVDLCSMRYMLHKNNGPILLSVIEILSSKEYKIEK